MDHYLTTYNKDFLWPNQGSGGTTPDVSQFTPDQLEFIKSCMKHTRPPDCRCPCYSGGKGSAGAGGRDPTDSSGQDWSRNQIMGPLLDPKLFPVRVGAPPETEISRHDQPNAFLDKLQSKFPMLYSILQNAPSSELKDRIERDRNKTTYRVDYCESGPGAKLENLQRAAGESGLGTCAAPVRLPGDPCRQRQKPRAAANRSFTKANQSGGQERTKCETKSGVPPLGRSEYTDGVSKLGAIIMRDKLHRRH